jgi:hypothetical protein
MENKQAHRLIGQHNKMQMQLSVGTVDLFEPKMRIELTTYALRVRCSTPELPGRR